MFRLISTNAQNGLKTAVLLKVAISKSATPSTVTLLPPGLTISSPSTITTPTIQSNILHSRQFVRNNSTSTDSPRKDRYKGSQPKRFNRGGRSDGRPRRKEWLDEESYQEKLDFDSMLAYGKGKKPTIENIEKLKAIVETVPSWARSESYTGYLRTLSEAAIQARMTRLAERKNRDYDQPNKYATDTIIRNAMVEFSKMINEGKFDAVLTTQMVYITITTMIQYRLNEEIINFWETGLNNNKHAELFMSGEVLGALFPVAYSSGKFNYEEIANIYKLAAETENPDVVLIQAFGLIALQAGKYEQALDCMEMLMNRIIENPGKLIIRQSLSRLHISFIGNCTDTTIARRFFTKALNEQDQLPYFVKFNIPFVISYFKNCGENGDSFEQITEDFRAVHKHLAAEMEKKEYSFTLVKLFAEYFRIFFQRYPELNDENRAKFWEMINSTAEITPEFLNVLIGECTWHDADFVNEIAEAYDQFGLEKNVILGRVLLKKYGVMSATNDEILEKWNSLLRILDQEGYTYIATADWGALRDATVLSKDPQERLGLFLALCQAYKDYMQDDEAAVTFLTNFIRHPSIYRKLTELVTEETPDLLYDGKIVVPEFTFLAPQINYKDATRSILEEYPPDSLVDVLPIVSIESASTSPVQKIAEELESIDKEIQTITNRIRGVRDADQIAKEIDAVVNEVESIAKQIKALSLGASSEQRDLNDIAKDVEAVSKEVEAIAKEMDQVVKN